MPKTKAAVDDVGNGIGGLDSFESRLTNLLALLLIKDMKVQSEQIAVLSRAGFPSSEIAGLLGTTTNTVSVALYQLKRSKKKK